MDNVAVPIKKIDNVLLICLVIHSVNVVKLMFQKFCSEGNREGMAHVYHRLLCTNRNHAQG